MEKQIIHIDMDDTLVNFSRAAALAILKEPGIMYPQSQHNFFRKLMPLPYAMETYHALRKSDLYEVWILTRPSILNRLCYTEKADWIAEYMGEDQLNRTIFSPDKGMVKGDFLVDDCLWPGFEGEHIHFGSEQYPAWVNVYNKFLGEPFKGWDEPLFYRSK